MLECKHYQRASSLQLRDVQYNCKQKLQMYKTNYITLSYLQLLAPSWQKSQLYFLFQIFRRNSCRLKRTNTYWKVLSLAWQRRSYGIHMRPRSYYIFNDEHRGLFVVEYKPIMLTILLILILLLVLKLSSSTSWTLSFLSSLAPS